MDWKTEIIGMTQCAEALEGGIDSTFFPPLPEIDLENWQRGNKLEFPPAWRELYLQTNGVEAQKGVIQVVLPLEECKVLPLEFPWIEFGKSETHRYYINLESDTVYRIASMGAEPEFFASTLGLYLKLMFQGKG